MRVLHVHSGNIFGGVESMLVTLARRRDLSPQMESHFALCFDGRLRDELSSMGVPVYVIGKTRLRQPASVLRARRTLRDLLDGEDFDIGICHSGWSQAIFGPVFRTKGLPLVCWYHDAAGGGNWLDRWSGRTLPGLAICNSEFTATALRNRNPTLRSEVVYCPVDSHETCSDADRAAIRNELQTPDDATVIIQVSRMEAWKGHRSLLEALSLLRDLPDWICWQIGGAQRPDETRYVEQLSATANQLGIPERVRFVGQRSDVPKLLRAADIFCQPNSSPEPFGIAFVEALYAGLPVVTTALGGACEIVNDSCGVLLPDAEPNALADSLRSLIQEPGLRRRLGAAGPERAQTLCDPQSQMRRISNILSAASHQMVTG